MSIFVDESGRFQHPDPSSRFYILGMVFHDQSSDISPLVADLVCTLHLIELRLSHGIQMTQSEMRFFGGPRDFKRNILKKIKAKEWP